MLLILFPPQVKISQQNHAVYLSIQTKNAEVFFVAEINTV